MWKFLIEQWHALEAFTQRNPLTGLLVFIGVYTLIWLITYFVAKTFINRILIQIAKRTKTDWDDAIIESKVLLRLSHIVPAIIVFTTWPLALHALDSILDFALWKKLVQKGVELFLILLFLNVTVKLTRVFQRYFETAPRFKDKPLGGFFQLLRIFFIATAVITFFSILLDKNPTAIFAGLGAATAVILLVFKDSLLGLVASVTIAANDLVRIGDWIEMPQHNADGNVEDITLSTVKIKNFDLTYTTVPAYAFVSDSFKNWRGPREANSRRIKREVTVKLSTVQFLDTEMADKLSKIELLAPYIEERKGDIEKYNTQKGISNPDVLVNGRNMTNLGCFRMYVVKYLRSREDISNDQTLLVRYLPLAQNGLPIELYTFTGMYEWGEAERVLSDVFDHLIAAMPYFGLESYQAHSSSDIRAIGEAITKQN